MSDGDVHRWNPSSLSNGAPDLQEALDRALDADIRLISGAPKRWAANENTLMLFVGLSTGMRPTLPGNNLDEDEPTNPADSSFGERLAGQMSQESGNIRVRSGWDAELPLAGINETEPSAMFFYPDDDDANGMEPEST